MNKVQKQYSAHTDEDKTGPLLPEKVVIIPIMNSPIFPGMIAPIILSEEKFTEELDQHLLHSGHVGLNLIKQNIKKKQIDIENQNIKISHIYKVGVLCKMIKKLKLPDGSVNILVHGIKRYQISDIIRETPLLETKYKIFDDILEEDDELDAYTRSVINQVKKISEINPYFNEEMKLAILNSSSPGGMADLVAFAISLDIAEAQDFLETLVIKKRFAKLLVYLKREKDVTDIQKKISDEVNQKVNQYQKEYFLKEQLKVIRTELGMDKDDKSRYIKKITEVIKKIKLSEQALQVTQEELQRLKTIPDSSMEYNVIQTYINWIIDLPWSQTSQSKISIRKSKKILNNDHYGLEKPKERILEFLAVKILRPEYNGSILCFSGPPGVGKTSLGKSIADATGRKFYRFNLGGMKDEAEIKGHRRTYIGAMPGKILQTLKKVHVNNPVIMLDEIDKIGESFQGDPASALLEVLDPEQNSNFIDNYLDIPFDLSKVLFIATANFIENIPDPLRDRMEVIELTGYSIEEKVLIAKSWIIPKLLEKHGLTKSDLFISVHLLKKLINDYAREPGIRLMEQYLSKLCRKAVIKKISQKKHKKFIPSENSLQKLLGSVRFTSEKFLKTVPPGIATGLAWTAYGGEILFIETLPLEGKSGLKLTGQLGDVMNESANIAYSYIKSLLQIELQKSSKTKKMITSTDPVQENYLTSHEIHLHLPAGATPKDGPSAGITMALALYSLATDRKVLPSMAMTGELSLTGKVLPVGGIKEKVLAAKRAGIKSIILPRRNSKDLIEVPEEHRKGLKIFSVENFNDVLKIALSK